MQECSEARYDEMLGILPPVLMLRKGFLVGEPFDHRLCKVTNVTIPEFKGLRRGEYPMTKKVFRKVRASSFGRPTKFYEAGNMPCGEEWQDVWSATCDDRCPRTHHARPHHI